MNADKLFTIVGWSVFSICAAVIVGHVVFAGPLDLWQSRLCTLGGVFLLPQYLEGVSYTDSLFYYAAYLLVITIMTSVFIGEAARVGWRIHTGEWKEYIYDE